MWRIIQDRNNETAWYFKGIALSDLERYDEAIRCYDKALEINPENLNSLYGKRRALINLGRYDEAKSCDDNVLKKKRRWFWCFLWSLRKSPCGCRNHGVLQPILLGMYIFKTVLGAALFRHLSKTTKSPRIRRNDKIFLTRSLCQVQDHHITSIHVCHPCPQDPHLTKTSWTSQRSLRPDRHACATM